MAVRYLWKKLSSLFHISGENQREGQWGGKAERVEGMIWKLIESGEGLQEVERGW